MAPHAFTVFVALFPGPWPRASREQLIKVNLGAEPVSLIALPSGQLQIEVVGPTGMEVWKSQPLEIKGFLLGIVSLGRDESGQWQLHINGRQVKEAGQGNDSLFFEGKAADPRTSGLFEMDLAPRRIVSNEESFFLKTLQEMQAKVSSGDRYDLIRSSALLRQLLVERVVISLNKNYKARMRFTVPERIEPPPVASAHFSAIRLLLPPTIPVKDVSLDEFLNTPCLFRDQVPNSVRSVIEACANYLGGVHIKKLKPNKAAERSVALADSQFFAGDQSLTLLTLSDICVVTLRGLEELAMAIRDGVFK